MGEKSTKAQQSFGVHQHAFKKDGRNVRMNELSWAAAKYCRGEMFFMGEVFLQKE